MRSEVLFPPSVEGGEKHVCDLSPVWVRQLGVRLRSGGQLGPLLWVLTVGPGGHPFTNPGLNFPHQ